MAWGLIHLSVCQTPLVCELILNLENSNIGSVNKSQAPSKKKPDGGLNKVAYSQPKATQKHHFPSLRVHSKHEGSPTVRRAGQAKPDWQAALAGHWRDPLANTGEPFRLDTGRILGRIHRQGILSRILGGIHCQASVDTQRDTQREPLLGCSGGILGGIH